MLTLLGIGSVSAVASAQEPCRRVVVGRETRTITLAEARTEARANSRSARAASARAIAAREGRRATASGRWPTLGVQAGAIRSDDPVFAFGSRLRQGTFGPADFDPARLNQPAPINDWGLTAGASWAPFDFAREAEIRAMGEDAEAAGLGAEWTARAAEFEAVVRYLEALAAEERLGTAAKALQAAEANLRRTSDRFAQGLLTEADVLQARAASEGARAALIDATRLRDDALDRLTLAVGWDGDVVATPGDHELSSLPATAGSDTELTSRPDLLASAHTVSSAEARLSRTQRSRLPTVEGFASLSTHSAEIFGTPEERWTMGFQVSIPIFTGFQISAREAGARAAVTAARLEHDERMAQAKVALSGAFRAVSSAQAGLAAAEAGAAAADEAARLVRRRFEEGLTTTADLLAAEARATEMATGAVDARLALHAAAARVDFLDNGDPTTNQPALSGGMDR